jgi:hypothetical protein
MLWSKAPGFKRLIIMNDSSVSFTLLVNSCDGFEDCWGPFFTLLERYWAAPHPPVILNTELKTFEPACLDMRCSQVQAGIERRLSWSECLSGALAMVETPLVLYMQEDYFIENPVDVDAIAALVQRMIDDPSIAHIGLTHFGAGSPILPDTRPMLSKIGPLATYRISTQAGLWRTNALQSYLLPWESGWMFELFGTVRSWKRNELFLTLDRDTTKPMIEYQHTGIVKGQWSHFVPALFKREGIAVDFAARGFYNNDKSALSRRLQLLLNIASNPAVAFKSIMAA